jgi:hypothetical protein
MEIITEMARGSSLGVDLGHERLILVPGGLPAPNLPQSPSHPEELSKELMAVSISKHLQTPHDIKLFNPFQFPAQKRTRASEAKAMERFPGAK